MTRADVLERAHSEKGSGAAGGEGMTPQETLPIYTDVFWQITLYAVGAGVLIIILGQLFLKRWLHGVN